MSSQTAIVSPAHVKHFADSLEESIKRLRGRTKQMREAVATANAVWKDDKYTVFRRRLESCIDDINKLNSLGTKYADFLREKASLAEKYLHRR